MNTGSLTSLAAQRRGALLPLLLAGLLMGCQPSQQEAASGPATGAVTSTAETASAPAGQGEHSHHSGHDMAGAASGAAASEAGTAKSADALPLEVKAATVTAVPPSLQETTAYVTLHNPTDQDIVLVGASTPAAGHAMLMQTAHTDASGASMSGMVEVGGLTVPAGGELKMASGGDHVMLMGLVQPLEEGRTVPLTLQDQEGRTLELDAVVQRP